jgi:hypothetical protein
MTFLTLRAAYFFYGYTVPSFQILVKFFIYAVELVAVITRRIREIYLGTAMAVDTPSHTQFRKLFYFIHFLYRAMAGLALYPAGPDMLGVAEEYVIREVVYFGPFNSCCGFCIFSCLGVIPDVTV